MNDEENLWYQKQIAIEGIKSSVMTALGIGLLAIGVSFGIAGNIIPPNLFEIEIGLSFIGFGTIVVLISAWISTKKIRALKYKPTS